MRRRPWLAGAAVTLVVAFAAGACGSDKKSSTTATTVAAPKFPAGSTMAAIQARGKINVGTKFDQPGFGLKNPTTGQVEGFDVEIAKQVAIGIFGGTPQSVAGKINFTEAVSAVRETVIENGTDDIVVATYTINNARKQRVSFAGPYYLAHQDIMVKKDDNSIKGVTDLNGKKVCTVSGSTSETNLKAKAPQAVATLLPTYSQCAELLTDGRVVAVTTDAPILAGLVQRSNGAFKLVNAPFTDEPYGIGLKRDDQAFRDFLNNRLETIYKDGAWATAFKDTLGKLGLSTPEPPAVDRYTAGAPAATTATTTGSATTASTSTTTSASASTTAASATSSSTP
jgi:glutamate transport system substrate-binding protein